MNLTTVKIEKPEDANFILGQTHFIKSVEGDTDIAWRKSFLREIGYKL